MQNPLVTLDEIIWKQFEKVTVKANKNLGWNKYDLARITDTAANLVTFTSFGVYTSIYGLLDNSPMNVIVGGFSTMWGFVGNNLWQKRNNEDEEKEIRYI